jgi:radical SAM protein with 4Fe4S-binding SPASM domain
MSLETIEDICRKIKPSDLNLWLWHGGEVTLMGAQWLNEATEIILNYFPTMHFTAQTNAYQVSDDLINYFKRYNVSVGFSFDGMYHDNTRGHASEILQNYYKMRDKGISMGPITVIDKNSVKYLKETLMLYKQLNINQGSFNWIYPVNHYKDKESVFANGFDNYVNYFKDFVKYYFFYTNDFSERVCNSFINLALGNVEHVPCNLKDCVQKNWLCVNPIGDIYPCDDPFDKELYGLGNVIDYNDLSEAYNHPNYVRYKQENDERLDYCLNNCKFSYVCKGGCTAQIVGLLGTASEVNPYHCKMFKEMYLTTIKLILSLNSNIITSINPSVRQQIMTTLNLDNFDLSIIKRKLLENNKDIRTEIVNYEL